MNSVIIFLLLCRIFQSYMPFIRRNSAIRAQTCCYFPEDENERKHKQIYYEHLPFNKDYIPLYTLVWHDCDSCKELLENMETLNLKHVYINGGEYFYDIEDVNNKFNTPLFYKEDIFIGDNLFDIYAEIYRGI